MFTTRTLSHNLDVPSDWPISIDDVHQARGRIAPYLRPTPLHNYLELDSAVGDQIRVWVKHENYNPTNSFKVRNGLSFMSALPERERSRGVVAATRGNHGLGIAFASRVFHVPATVCVPLGNNPEKNHASAGRPPHRGGAGLRRGSGRGHAHRGRRRCHARPLHQRPERHRRRGHDVARDRRAGAGTGRLGDRGRRRLAGRGCNDRGPGSRARSRRVWGAGRPITLDTANTFADGLATRSSYDLTFPALRDGLADFVTVTDAEIADSMRLLMRTTHSMVEGAGAAGLAGLRKLAKRLAGQRVGIVISGSNVDESTLRRVVNRDI